MVESQLLTCFGVGGIENLGATTPIQIQNPGIKGTRSNSFMDCFVATPSAPQQKSFAGKPDQSGGGACHRFFFEKARLRWGERLAYKNCCGYIPSFFPIEDLKKNSSIEFIYGGNFIKFDLICYSCI